MAKSCYSYELIFVDDCSPDTTRDVIKTLCVDDDRSRYIFHPVNLGRGAAFKTGFSEAIGDVVGFIDIDLEVGAHYIPPLLRLILEDHYDVAIGHRHYQLGQTGGWTRHILSHGYQILSKFLLNTGIRDSETGCKFFRRSTCEKAVLSSRSNGWFWDSEVMSRSAFANLAIIELPVLFFRRHDKQSTVRVFRDSWQYLIALWRFRPEIGLGMLDRSPLYWTLIGYDMVMAVLYRGYIGTVRAVVEEIPEGCTVTDVCCGTALLYRRFLKHRQCRYLGLDANGHFIAALRRRGVSAQLFDLTTDPLETTGCVIMLSSFYHFYQTASETLKKLQAAARDRVVISEPVRNVSNLPGIGRLANWLTRPGPGEYRDRFTLQEFRAFAEAHGALKFVHRDGENNAMAVFRGEAGAAPDRSGSMGRIDQTVYSERPGIDERRQDRQCPRRVTGGLVGLAKVVACGLIRVSTNARVFRSPVAACEADHVRALLERRSPLMPARGCWPASRPEYMLAGACVHARRTM